MLAFLPVSRFRVHYQVASGRPYSALERFLLEAVQEDHATLDRLVDLFRVHRRTVIEGVVTLMQAGWLGLRPGNDHQFEVTDAGREALKQPGTLPPNTALNEKSTYLIMELVRGQIAPYSAVTFWERRKLAALWEQGVKIPKSDISYSPESGQVRPLLRTKAEQGEYIRATGPIQFDRHNADYLVVDVDTANRRLVGVPSEWEAELVDELVERALRRETELKEKSEEIDDEELREFVRVMAEGEEEGQVPNTWTITSNTFEFVHGTEAHRDLLLDSLRRASSCVVVTSAVLTRAGVNDLLADILKAVERGVLIDVLWGWHPDAASEQDHAAAVKMLRALEDNTRSMVVPGRLQFAERPSLSNVGVLIADPGGAFEATLGCCQWLAGKKGAASLSLRVTHPGVVSRLCSLTADLIAGDSHLETSAIALQLLNASADLDASILQEANRAEKTPNDVEVRLLLDRQNDFALREAARYAGQRLIISSRHWTPASLETLGTVRKALEAGGRQASVCFGGAESPPSAAESIVEELEKLGVSLTPSPEPPPNYAVADDQVFLGSRDWLGGSAQNARPRLCDLGISLRGPGVVDRLLTSVTPGLSR